MPSVSILRTKDQQQSFRPLVISVVDQLLADHMPTTVQDLYQMVSVLDLPAAEEHPKLSIGSIGI